MMEALLEFIASVVTGRVLDPVFRFIGCLAPLLIIGIGMALIFLLVFRD
jgi:hypothetical protein